MPRCPETAVFRLGADSSLIQIEYYERVRARGDEQQEPQVPQPDTAVVPIDHLVDGRAVWPRHGRAVAEGVVGRNSYRARVARHTSPGVQPATVRTGPSI